MASEPPATQQASHTSVEASATTRIAATTHTNPTPLKTPPELLKFIQRDITFADDEWIEVF